MPTVQGNGMAGVPLAYDGDKLPPVPARSPGIHKITYYDSSNWTPGHGNALGLSAAVHQPNAACDLHTHRGATESFVVVRGHGAITVGDKTVLVKMGDALVVPAGVPHMVEAFGDGLYLICVLTRAPGSELDPQPWLPIESGGEA